MATVTLEVLNEASYTDWQAALGWVFEHSPWVSEKAWIFRPFSSIDQLHQVMLQNVLEASYEQQINLIRAHPNLATKLALSESSQKEQQGVGLDRLSTVEYAEFTENNDAYIKKFNFPFILAVRGHTKASILASMRERIYHTVEEEQEKALNEIRKISLFRLKDLIIE